MTTLDLEQLQQRWQAQDAKLDRLAIRLDRDTVASTVSGLFLPVWWDIAMDALLVLMFGLFIGNRLEVWDAELRFLVPAALLFALSIAAFASSVRQLITLHAIAPTHPVSEAQQAVESLRAHRILVTKAVFLLAPVVWIPLLIVAVRALGGDLYAYMSAGFLIANAVLCALFIPAVLLAAHVYGERVLKYRWIRELHDELGGSRFVEARDRLAEMEAFRRGD